MHIFTHPYCAYLCAFSSARASVPQSGPVHLRNQFKAFHFLPLSVCQGRHFWSKRASSSAKSACRKKLWEKFLGSGMKEYWCAELPVTAGVVGGWEVGANKILWFTSCLEIFIYPSPYSKDGAPTQGGRWMQYLRSGFSFNARPIFAIKRGS